VKAYETYVHPLLEYAVCVWSPYQFEDITKVESVNGASQSDFTVYLILATVTG